LNRAAGVLVGSGSARMPPGFDGKTMSETEVEQLRSQLAAARAALRAVRAGEIDAALEPMDEAPGVASAERPYRLMIEHMHEGAVTTALETSAILFCNRSFARMMGLPRSVLKGLEITEIVRQVGDVSVVELLDGAAPRRGDFELSTANGAHLPVSISATSVVGNGTPTRCLIISDRTERQDNERLRRVRRQLEAANRRKTEFIAMLGHELRNPLAPIRQAVELMQAGGDALSPEASRRALQVIERQVRHMTRLVDDLLDAGRISQGTIKVQPQAVVLQDVLAGAVESTQRLLDRREHRLISCLPPDPITLMADPVRLTQVCANLLSNAAKYTSSGGVIELGAELVSAGVRIWVRDNGNGIAPDLLPQLFEPFVQGQASLARAGGGLGVGLTLVKRLVELHGGRVQAHSAGPGHGSEFEVELPIRVVEKVENPRRSVGSRPSARHRVLVVDDNEDAAEMMAMVLRDRGHEVEAAFDGVEALAKLDAFGPQVVCLDIGLPGMDGFEVARRMRARSGGDALVLLAVTGYGQDTDRLAAQAAGFDDLIVKPTSGDALEQAIARFERGRTAVAEVS
jgi:PAS domain S-box-containing protein